MTINYYITEGKRHYEQENFAKALQSFQKAIWIEVTAENCTLIGQVFIDLEKYSIASLYLRQALRIDEKYKDALWALSELYTYLNEFKLSGELMVRYAALSVPDLPDEKHSQHTASEHDAEDPVIKEFEERSNQYNRALLLDATDLMVLIEMGEAYQNLGQYEKAIDCFNNALKIDMSRSKWMNADIYYRLGVSLSEIRKYEEAIDSFNRSLEFGATPELVYYALAIIFIGKRKYEEATHYLKLTIEENPESVSALIALGTAQKELSMFQESLDSFNTALKQDPNSINALYGIGALYHKNRMYEKTIEYVRQVINIDPEFSLAYVLLAGSYYELRQYKKSIEYCKIAITNKSTIAGSYDLLARIYCIYGINGEAMKNLNAYIYLSLIRHSIILVKLHVKAMEESPYAMYTVLNNFDIELPWIMENNIDGQIAQIDDFFLYLPLITSSPSLTTKQKNIYKSILMYYLGGAVDAYKILDSEDLHEEMAGVQSYYRAVTSYYTCVHFEEDIPDCIHELQNSCKNDEDYYYLGQLYLLNDEPEMAKIEFERSAQNFIFSQIMLFHVEESEQKKKTLFKQIEQSTSKLILGPTIYNHQNREMIFDELKRFIHCKECETVIHELIINYGLAIDSRVLKPIWKVYQLSDHEADDLYVFLLETKGKMRLNKLYNDLPKIEEQAKNSMKEVSELKTLLHKQTEEHQKIVERLNLLQNNPEFEDYLANSIESMTPELSEFYIYILKYYFLEDKINIQQFFNLCAYLVYKCKKQFTVRVTELLKSFCIDLVELQVQNMHIIWQFSTIVAKHATLFMFRHESFKKHFATFRARKYSEYDFFKEDMWRMLEHNDYNNGATFLDKYIL